jgi:hypothetical protein
MMAVFRLAPLSKGYSEFCLLPVLLINHIMNTTPNDILALHTS